MILKRFKETRKLRALLELESEAKSLIDQFEAVAQCLRDVHEKLGCRIAELEAATAEGRVVEAGPTTDRLNAEVGAAKARFDEMLAKRAEIKRRAEELGVKVF